MFLAGSDPFPALSDGCRVRGAGRWWYELGLGWSMHLREPLSRHGCPVSESLSRADGRVSQSQFATQIDVPSYVIQQGVSTAEHATAVFRRTSVKNSATQASTYSIQGPSPTPSHGLHSFGFPSRRKEYKCWEKRTSRHPSSRIGSHAYTVHSPPHTTLSASSLSREYACKRDGNRRPRS